jgi:hypothetical protein
MRSWRPSCGGSVRWGRPNSGWTAAAPTARARGRIFPGHGLVLPPARPRLMPFERLPLRSVPLFGAQDGRARRRPECLGELSGAGYRRVRAIEKGRLYVGVCDEGRTMIACAPNRAFGCSRSRFVCVASRRVTHRLSYLTRGRAAAAAVLTTMSWSSRSAPPQRHAKQSVFDIRLALRVCARR